MRCRTYRYRLHPTQRQRIELERQLNLQRELYNAALEERIGAWRRGHSVTYVDQTKELKELRDVRPEVLAAGVTLCRGTLKRLDRAYAGFFRRLKAGETPGFPRFKGANRFASLQWEDRNGWKLKDEERRLRLLGVGEVKANFHRAVKGTPKAITVKREGRKWWLTVRCVDVPAAPLPSTGREVGVDVGVVNLVALSTGEVVAGPRFGEATKERLALAQQKLARQQRGSARQACQVEVAASLHRKVVNQRTNAAHQLSRRLVNEFDLIVLEKLTVTSMARTPRAVPDPAKPGEFLPNGAAKKAGLNRSIHDAGWATLTALLIYKAESAGRDVVNVSARHTSQTCAECGHVEAGNRVSRAAFRCRSCGHEAHADSNAARNILRAGRAQRALARAG